jgi:hypothetical protein
MVIVLIKKIFFLKLTKMSPLHVVWSSILIMHCVCRCNSRLLKGRTRTATFTEDIFLYSVCWWFNLFQSIYLFRVIAIFKQTVIKVAIFWHRFWKEYSARYGWTVVCIFENKCCSLNNKSWTSSWAAASTETSRDFFFLI